MRAPDEVAAMVRLKALGWGVRRIAVELGCSHMTVPQLDTLCRGVSRLASEPINAPLPGRGGRVTPQPRHGTLVSLPCPARLSHSHRGGPP